MAWVASDCCGKGEGGIDNRLDGKTRQSVVDGQLRRINGIHHGVADIEPGIPDALRNTLFQGHVPLSGTAGATIQEREIIRLLVSAEFTLIEKRRVQGGGGGDAVETVEHQVLPDELGNGAG